MNYIRRIGPWGQRESEQMIQSTHRMAYSITDRPHGQSTFFGLGAAFFVDPLPSRRSVLSLPLSSSFLSRMHLACASSRSFFRHSLSSIHSMKR